MWKKFNDTYSVSDSGEVRNDKRSHILKGDLNSKGYLRVRLNNKQYLIHRLVALLYIPNPNNYPQVNHLDMNKINNKKNNLEWCTNSQNMVHALLNSGKTKLSNDNITYILHVLNNKLMSGAALARELGVHPTTVNSIYKGRNLKGYLEELKM